MQTYGKEVAKQIINTRQSEFIFADDGIRPTLVSVENTEFDQLMNWTPACELDGDDAPDPQIVPSLPIPFNASELAAWMLHGGGYFVREQYGDWADGPDPQAMAKLGTQATKAKRALRQAFDAYRAAERVVGAYDTSYSEKIQELENQHGHWPDDKEARQQIKQAHLDADEYEAEQHKQMVNQLLAVSQVTLPIDGTAPAQNTAASAPVEAVEDRRARYLAWHAEEQRISPRGALQRVYVREAKQNPKADRANIGKDIKKARGTAKTQKQAKAWTSQLVTDGKR